MPTEPVAAVPEAEPLELWCAYPDDLLSEPFASACAALLSEEEQARCERLRFEPDRRVFLATRALVRMALSDHHPIAPEAWRFRTNEFGRPEAEPECGVRFNLTNTPGLVVCVIAHGIEVGIDAEPLARAGEILGLAPDVFSPQELAQLDSLSASVRADRALTLWTLKEAYIKARGMGLSLPLKNFRFLFGGREGIRLETDWPVRDEARRWRFCLLDHGEHRIALMAEARSGQAAPGIQLWETRLFSGPARQLSGQPGPWFPR